MRTTRYITASLCAVLGAAALAGPAAAGQPGAADSAKADVYVPPAALSTATPAKADVYVPPAALSAANPGTHAPNPKPIRPHVPATSAPSAGFDWGSAAIGAAVIVGALLLGLGAAELRRRRQIQPAPVG
jgi:hypothetical protein